MKKHVSSYLEFLNENLEQTDNSKTYLLTRLLTMIGDELTRTIEAGYGGFWGDVDYCTVSDGLLTFVVSDSLTDSLDIVDRDGDTIRIWQEYMFMIRLTYRNPEKYDGTTLTKEEAESSVVLPSNFEDILSLTELGLLSFADVLNLCNIKYLYIDMDVVLSSKDVPNWEIKDSAFGGVDITPKIKSVADLIAELIPEIQDCQNAVQYREEDIQQEINDNYGDYDDEDDDSEEDDDESEEDEE